MVTAVAALQLVESGQLGLETPITDVLDHSLGAVTPAHTLHHLLCHMSGIQNYHDDDDDTWASFTSCGSDPELPHPRG